MSLEVIMGLEVSERWSLAGQAWSGVITPDRIPIYTIGFLPLVF